MMNDREVEIARDLLEILPFYPMRATWEQVQKYGKIKGYSDKELKFALVDLARVRCLTLDNEGYYLPILH